MTMVSGFDVNHTARVVEVNSDNKEHVQEMLESAGWTGLVFIEN